MWDFLFSADFLFLGFDFPLFLLYFLCTKVLEYYLFPFFSCPVFSFPFFFFKWKLLTCLYSRELKGISSFFFPKKFSQKIYSHNEVALFQSIEKQKTTGLVRYGPALKSLFSGLQSSVNFEPCKRQFWALHKAIASPELALHHSSSWPVFMHHPRHSERNNVGLGIENRFKILRH